MKRVNFWCSLDDCEKPAKSRQLCKVHYELWLRHSNPEWAEKHREKSRKYRMMNGDKWRKAHSLGMKKYRRTKIGYMRHKYLQMKTRIRGRPDRKNDSWRGKSICTREEFLRWSMQNPSFHRLFRQWLHNQNNPKLWPSIDRIKNTEGYIIGNMRWVTHSENSSG